MSKQERATRTRNALILSAAELFERYGYVRASLDEISSGARVSRGALHFHFENKAAVADAVEQAAARTLRATAQAIPLGQSSAIQSLMDLSHRMVHLLHHDVVVRAGFRLNCDTGPRTPLDLRQEWQACVRRLVTRAADERALAAGVCPDGLVATVVATTVGLEVLSRANRGWLSTSSLTTFWQLLLPSVASPPTLPTLQPGGTPTP
ncbi:TetR family transcriptional regulator [Streptomyces venezuelae]|uniref:TetR family transcriptional regulator n=1 Tax=Streptomyces venezuelae TaxID=54571 RepID=A0A5P2CRW4_STRVZ|nr:ScbR family autoregulator-binding transcription factor [Streptomyces venezuelae]QES39692.1 TetR family transcriptional regulator [Streptomyces venezuelae]QES45652.1 TetR family transcriptional regulator [Streptomyces venezuelae]